MKLNYNDSGYQAVEHLPLKAQIDERRNDAMTGKPATEKQKSIINKLGYTLTAKADRHVASQVIWFAAHSNFSESRQVLDMLTIGGYIIKQ